MYKVRKLYLGNHELDNGKTWVGYGFAVINKQGQIVTSSGNVEVFDYKNTAVKSADYYNRKRE